MPLFVTGTRSCRTASATEGSMSDEQQVTLLCRSIREWNRWRAENPQVTPDLAGAGLRGVNFSGANLAGANLKGADLRGAVLSGCMLIGAELATANFFKAVLDGADVDRAVSVPGGGGISVGSGAPERPATSLAQARRGD